MHSPYPPLRRRNSTHIDVLRLQGLALGERRVRVRPGLLVRLVNVRLGLVNVLKGATRRHVSTSAFLSSLRSRISARMSCRFETTRHDTTRHAETYRLGHLLRAGEERLAARASTSTSASVGGGCGSGGGNRRWRAGNGGVGGRSGQRSGRGWVSGRGGDGVGGWVGSGHVETLRTGCDEESDGESQRYELQIQMGERLYTATAQLSACAGEAKEDRRSGQWGEDRA